MAMRKLVLLAIGALAIATPTVFAASAPPTTVTAFAASLVSKGERPAPKGAPAGAGGTFSAIITRTGGTASIAWTLQFAKLSGPAVAAHIHTGKPGQVGPVSLPLCQPCTANSRGTKTLDAKLLAAIESGSAYVNVHTKANPGGEIRGQVGRSHALAAGLVAAGETPAPQNVPAAAKGSFTALVIDTSPRPILTWSLEFDGLSGPASAAHIHLGKPGAAGAVVLPLCGPCATAVQGRKEIQPTLAEAIEAGNTYVNVHTQANAAGEIRGQVLRGTQGVAALQSSLGPMLVDDRGMTLYMFAKDAGTQSACYDRCATFWPPAFAVGSAVAAQGTSASLLGVASRSDGTSMLTYGGYPLYGFLQDTQPGELKGQGSNGFGSPWWVLVPATGKTNEARAA
jgi:predicted lipoprotein with Yx(FWY)xxD motif